MRHAICELGSERLGVTAMQQGAGMVMVGTTLARAPFLETKGAQRALPLERSHTDTAGSCLVSPFKTVPA